MESVSTNDQFEEMQAYLLGEDGGEIVLAMMENARILNTQFRETFDELDRRSQRKLARRVIRTMLANIETEVWDGMRGITTEEAPE